MTFEEILDQAMAMLQRRGRVTYRTLQRQFDLDEGTLADLKDAICFAHPQVVEEERGLVWPGVAEPTLTSPLSSQPVLPPDTHADQPTPVEPPLATPSTPEAERRQLTVLFCDLVDSTRLARQLDPEDYREVVRTYQQDCAEVIQRFDGYIAQYLGDGLLVYFGYPQAHEDDAQRAGWTGLDILAAMEPLNARLEQERGIRLAVRVGIHTGPVVVGAMGGGGRQEQLALGDTPNLAARLQAMAAPNTVVVSAATVGLIEGFFTCQALGEHALKGVEEPLRVYQLLAESGAQTRLDVASPSGLTPLVGRETEVMLLRERWAQARDGLGQVVVLSGEAGIGKSRLVLALKEQVAGAPHTRWECRCSPYFQESALYPVIDLSQRALQFARDEPPEAKLQKIAAALGRYGLAQAEAMSLWASLLSVPLADRYPPLTLTPQRQKQKTLEAVVTLLLALAAEQPVLFIVEDLHWVDPSTLEFLTLLIDQGPTTRLLTLLTCRPEFHAPWGFRAHLTPLTLSRLPRPQVAQMSVRVAGGKALPAEVVEQIVAKTDGVPLFVEELTKTVLESGLLRECEDHYALTGPLPPLAIPATLHDALMARLDRLATVKAVAQLGATIGRTFAYELLRAVSPLDEATLQHGLRQLVEAELVYQRGGPPQATYIFKHALIQDTAYQSLLRSTRQRYHQHIARVLEAQFPETATTQPELLAHHYTEAGLNAQAVVYWQQAGEGAIQRCAHVEARAHLTTGLALVTTLPPTPARYQHELALHLALGSALMASKGFGALEVERVYTRARELAQQVGDTRRLFWALRGLRTFSLVHGQLQRAHELGEQLLRVAEDEQDAALLTAAHSGMGPSYFYRGELAAAYTHSQQGYAPYTPEQDHAQALLYGVSTGAASLAYAAMARWGLGFPQQALRHSRDAVTWAQETRYPASLALPLAHAAWLYQFRREAPGVQAQAEALLALAHAQGFPFWGAMATILRGWALTAQGQGTAGVAQMHQGLAAYHTTGAAMGQTYLRALLVEGYGNVGQVDTGLRLLAEILAVVESTGERIWEAELYRLQGTLLLGQGTLDEHQVEACFQTALDITRRQQAKSLELRAAMSLSRLWQRQGKREEARELLAPIYGWFTEGFDTADLQDAKVLLEALM
jgi:TOMM system kinase/cyclase fusion protein